MTRKTALIFGVGGQDGAYLSQLLLDKGYAVHGTSRDAELATFANLRALGIRERVSLYSAVPTDCPRIRRPRPAPRNIVRRKRPSGPCP